MPSQTDSAFPNPFGFQPIMSDQYARCYQCEQVTARKDMAALPVGYFRMSVDIAPTWQENGEIKARALIGPYHQKNLRPIFLQGVPFVCRDCWLLCCQVDAIAQESGVQFGAWEDPPPPHPM